MTVCKKCNGTGELRVPVEEHLGTVLYGTEQCDECDGTGEVLTNEEWFCSLPTEEKAEWLENKMTWAAQEQGTFTAKGWAKWLKQPHTTTKE